MLQFHGEYRLSLAGLAEKTGNEVIVFT